jgi:predicted DNA-binding transcriptional regulator YafY
VASFERRLQVQRLLEAEKREWSLRELAQRFGVSKLTVQRDLDELSRAGVPIEAREDGQKLCWFLRRAPEPGRASAQPTGVEALALNAAGQALQAFRGTELFVGLERARVRHGSFPLHASTEVLRPRYPLAARRLSPAVVRTVVTAIADSQRVSIEYQARGHDDCCSLVLEPSGFEEVAGVVYLQGSVAVGRTRERRTLIGWRIRSAKLLDEHFVAVRRRPRPAFGAVEGRAEQVVVRFDADLAPFIEERVWHPSQRLAYANDGSLTWTARVSGMHEVVGWVMSWGARAELVSPAAWREEVRRRLEGMVRCYGLSA